MKATATDHSLISATGGWRSEPIVTRVQRLIQFFSANARTIILLSANTHLIASKPVSSPVEPTGLNHDTSQPRSDATCPRINCAFALLQLVTVFCLTIQDKVLKAEHKQKRSKCKECNNNSLQTHANMSAV